MQIRIDMENILIFLSSPTTANNPPILISSGSMPCSAPKRPNSTWSALEEDLEISSVQPPLGGPAQTPEIVKAWEMLS
jgi:hypothetical protein